VKNGSGAFFRGSLLALAGVEQKNSCAAVAKGGST
jgi:hypothetical protein